MAASSRALQWSNQAVERLKPARPVRSRFPPVSYSRRDQDRQINRSA